MARSLVIQDDDGAVLGRLRIPDGATVEQITAAGLAARERLLAKKRVTADTPTAPAAMEPGAAPPARLPSIPAPKRQLMCQACREVFYEDDFAMHVETVEKPRVEAALRTQAAGR